MSPSMLLLQSELRTLRQPDWSPRESAGFTAQMCGSLDQHSLWEFCLTACLTASSTDTPSKRRPMSFAQVSSCMCVHRRFFLLFASVSLASFAPDIVDHGPRMLRSATGIWTPVLDASRLFPWHWPDGSGSMYSMLSKAPEPTRILD